MKKEEKISALRAKLTLVEVEGPLANDEEVFSVKENEQTAILKIELKKNIQECQRMADALVEMERRKMEEKMLQQQQELEELRRRLEDIESELQNSREKNRSVELEGSNFAKKLLEFYTDEDPGMEKSVDLDKSLDFDMGKRDVVVTHKTENNSAQAIIGTYQNMSKSSCDEAVDQDLSASNFANKTCLSTVYEDEEEEVDEDDGKENLVDEVRKEVIQEKTVCPTARVPLLDLDSVPPKPLQRSVLAPLVSQDTAIARQMRIQNIFTLCGSHRELSHHKTPSTPTRVVSKESPLW